GERPVAEVELDALAQPERPPPEVRASLPLLGEARRVRAGLRIDLEQRLEEWVELQMVRTGHHPEPVRVLEPRGGEHELVHLRLRGGWRRRGYEAEDERDDESCQHGGGAQSRPLYPPPPPSPPSL